MWHYYHSVKSDKQSEGKWPQASTPKITQIVHKSIDHPFPLAYYLRASRGKK